MPSSASSDAAVNARADALLEVDESLRQLTQLVRVRMRNAAKAIDPALPVFGLKMLQLLKSAGSLHPGTVAEALMVDKSLISRQARQLEELGLIEVQPDPTDGRARLLVLTPAAAERVTAVQTGIILDPEILKSWSAEELHQFAGYLSRLSRGNTIPAAGGGAGSA